MHSYLVETTPAKLKHLLSQKQLLPKPIQQLISYTESDPDQLVVSPNQHEYTSDEISKVIEWGNKHPYQKEFRLAIINQAQRLSVIAQNKLLKTLEEPHSHTRYLLIASNSGALLDTIISRCFNFAVPRARQGESELVTAILASTDATDAYQQIDKLIAADNSAELAEQLFSAIFDKQTQSVDQAMPAGDFADFYHHLHKNKFNLRLTLEGLITMLLLDNKLPSAHE